MAENTFSTVTEAEANAATLDIYADIKSTMGVALVNLIWRHLATTPTVLHWSWHALKPHYVSGAVPTSAWLLRESLEIPRLEAINSDEWSQLKRELDNPTELDAILGTYERGNAQNLVAMCFLQACLADIKRASAELPSLNSSQRAAEIADRATTTLPPLPDWNTLNPDIQATIAAMTEVWVPDEYRGPTPSVFRHMSYWPGILRLYQKRLTALHSNSAQTLSAISQQTIEHAQIQANNLGSDPENLPPLSRTDQRWLQSVLDLFIYGMISRGVVIVPAMRATLATAIDQHGA